MSSAPHFKPVIGAADQIKFVKEIARDAEITALRSRIILHIATALAFIFADRDSPLVFVAKSTLAKIADADEKSIWRAIQALRNRGYLFDTGARKGRAHVFEMRTPIRAPMPEIVSDRSGMDARIEDFSRAPVSVKAGADVPEIGRPCLSHIEPTSEPTSEPIGGGTAAREDEEVSFEEICDRFVRAWGFDNPTDLKDPAVRVLSTLTRREQLAAIGAASRYRDACRNQNCRPRHAKTWLNDKGWQGFGSAPASDQKAPDVFIEVGSRQAAAWTRHHLSKTGRKPLMIEMNAPGGRRAVGRYESTEWPPGHRPLSNGGLPENARSEERRLQGSVP